MAHGPAGHIVVLVVDHATVAATVPGAPTGLTPTPGSTQVGLSWTAPASDGGSALSDFTVQYKVH